MDPMSLEARVAETIADFSAVPGGNPEMQAALARVLMRFGGDRPAAVPLSEAAAELGVSVPTVRTWVERGVLQEVGTRRVRSVSAVSLGRALAAQRTLGATSGTKRQLALILDELERTEMLAAARAVSAASEPSTRVRYSAGDLAEIAEG
jgi:hypothetical protein